MKLNEKPFWTRVALLGIGMYLFLAVLIGVPIIIFSPGDILFPVIIAIVVLVIGSLIYFIQPWGLIVAVLGGLFGLLFSSDGIDLALGSPQSFFDFAFGLLSLIGAVLILVGGVAGLIQHFKHQTSTSGPSTVTMAIKGVLGIMGVLFVISAILTVAGMGGVSAAEKEGATLVTAKEVKFDVATINASSSGTTKVVVKNKDVILHTFTVDDLDIDVKVGPGQEKLIEIRSPSAGTYEFYCRIVGHEEDMRGDLVAR